MARGGVTFTEVDEAARYLQGLGRNPTVDAIRERLGTGSRTTLSEHLKRWKSLQGNSEGCLPQPLQALVSGLWDSLQSMAEQRVQEHQSIAHQEVAALKTQLQAARQIETQLHQECHQLQEILDAEQRSKSVLATQLQTAEKSHDKLQALHQSTLQQLDDAKQENHRLHTLATKIQANLEHYQQAIQQQQLERNLEKEKQQAAYSQELSQLKSLLMETQLHCKKNEKALASSQSELQHIQAMYEKQSCSHEKLVAKLQEIELEFIQLQALESSQKQQLEKIAPELLTSQHLHNQLNQQIAVLNNQLQRAKTDLVQAEDKIENLRHEKMFLVQEKSQLEGMLKNLTEMRV